MRDPSGEAKLLTIATLVAVFAISVFIVTKHAEQEASKLRLALMNKQFAAEEAIWSERIIEAKHRERIRK